VIFVELVQLLASITFVLSHILITLKYIICKSKTSQFCFFKKNCLLQVLQYCCWHLTKLAYC